MHPLQLAISVRLHHSFMNFPLSRIPSSLGHKIANEVHTALSTHSTQCITGLVLFCFNALVKHWTYLFYDCENHLSSVGEICDLKCVMIRIHLLGSRKVKIQTIFRFVSISSSYIFYHKFRISRVIDTVSEFILNCLSGPLEREDLW